MFLFKKKKKLLRLDQVKLVEINMHFLMFNFLQIIMILQPILTQELIIYGKELIKKNSDFKIIMPYLVIFPMLQIQIGHQTINFQYVVVKIKPQEFILRIVKLGYGMNIQEHKSMVMI